MIMKSRKVCNYRGPLCSCQPYRSFKERRVKRHFNQLPPDIGECAGSRGCHVREMMGRDNEGTFMQSSGSRGEGPVFAKP